MFQVWRIGSACRRLQECRLLDKSMSFPELDASDELFVFVKQVSEFVKEEAGMFMILSFMKAKSKVVIGELPMVYDFP